MSGAGETAAGRLVQATTHRGKYLLHAQLGNTCLCSACRNGPGGGGLGLGEGADAPEECCESSGAG